MNERLPEVESKATDTESMFESGDAFEAYCKEHSAKMDGLPDFGKREIENLGALGRDAFARWMKAHTELAKANARIAELERWIKLALQFDSPPQHSLRQWRTDVLKQFPHLCAHKFIDTNSCLKCGWTPTK